MLRYLKQRKKQMKKSSLEFKQMQRDKILAIEPWKKSTGSRTPAGKTISR